RSTPTRVLLAPAAPPTTPPPDRTCGTVVATLHVSATVPRPSSPTLTPYTTLFRSNNLTCSPTGAAPVYTQTVPLTGLSASTSPGFTTTAAGIYYWTAHYSGDTNNNHADSACADEVVILGPAGPSITTTPDPTAGTV